jgi:hypothetical protein
MASGMTIQEAIKILRKHNEWRRGNNDEQEDPKVIGQALDKLLDYLDAGLLD